MVEFLTNEYSFVKSEEPERIIQLENVLPKYRNTYHQLIHTIHTVRQKLVKGRLWHNSWFAS